MVACRTETAPSDTTSVPDGQMGRRARPVATYTRAPLLIGRGPATAGGLLARLAAVARTRREAKDHSPLPVRSRPTGARPWFCYDAGLPAAAEAGPSRTPPSPGWPPRAALARWLHDTSAQFAVVWPEEAARARS